MGRRKQSGLETLASMPWPVGIGIGLAGFWVINHGIGLYFSKSGAEIANGIGKAFSSGTLAPLAWFWLIACSLAAVASYFGQKRRERLLETQRDVDSLRSLDWREFEQLVGEAFRRQGYTVEETGQGGADGGVDLVLRRDGESELVQCKQWRNKQVSVSVVREMYGLLAHHRAARVKVVSVGQFTRDAARFAEGKPIELINGEQLIELVRSGQSTRQTPIEAPASAIDSPESGARLCPSCGAGMVERRNKNNGQTFWGCSTFPRCRGTRPI